MPLCRALVALAAASLFGAAAAAEEGGTPAEATTLIDDQVHEVIVYGTGFERWDDTWWAVNTELSLPFGWLLRSERNFSVLASGIQVRSVFHCEKSAPIGRKRYEIDCRIDDIGIQMVTSEEGDRIDKAEEIQEMLDEVDAKLTGAAMQLQVNADGRVGSVTLEGLENTVGRRENQIAESLRALLARSMAGFHMRLRKVNQLAQGQWVEYDSPLMRMPDAVTASMGSSLLVNQLNVYQGHHVVQTVGRGVITSVDAISDGATNHFQTNFNGVAIYDADTGYMTERIWHLVGQPTASSQVSLLGTPPTLGERGRLWQIDPEEYISVGASEQVAPPGVPTAGLSVWTPID